MRRCRTARQPRSSMPPHFPQRGGDARRQSLLATTSTALQSRHTPRYRTPFRTFCSLRAYHARFAPSAETGDIAADLNASLRASSDKRQRQSVCLVCLQTPAGRKTGTGGASINKNSNVGGLGPVPDSIARPAIADQRAQDEPCMRAGAACWTCGQSRRFVCCKSCIHWPCMVTRPRRRSTGFMLPESHDCGPVLVNVCSSPTANTAAARSLPPLRVFIRPTPPRSIAVEVGHTLVVLPTLLKLTRWFRLSFRAPDCSR